VTAVPGIAVAISTLGRADALVRCLQSLVAGTHRPTTVAVVDQSSSGAAAKAAEAFVDLLPLMVERQAATGLAVGQNRAVELTSEPMFAVIDDDCVAAPDWLETVARVFEARPELAGVAGRVLPLGPDAPGLYPVSLRTSTVRRDLSRGALPWDVGSGNNFALRREWFDTIGGCDTRLGPGSPGRGAVDIDLFHRLLQAGGLLRYEPDAIVYHERKSHGDRLSRRVGYGHGMGAACGLWLRARDRDAGRILRAWFVLRASLLAGEVKQGHWRALPEEMLVVGSTVAGLVHGLARGRKEGTARA
jgi:GT2 family glycosyltransferase